MALSKQPIHLSGDYAGSTHPGLRYRFRFCSDHTYFFLAELPGLWQFAHQGIFTIADIPDSTPYRWKRKRVKLQPQRIDIPVTFPSAVSTLEERVLPVDSPREYILSAYDLGPHRTQLSFEAAGAGHLGLAQSFFLEKGS